MLIVLSCVLAGLFVLYSRGPTFENAFASHWSTSDASVNISLAFVFGLVALALIYETYLSVLVFRVLCDVSVRYPVR